jgi:hypothetical protein
VAVPFDVVIELESAGLAFPLPVFRGAALDAVVTIGADAATLVSLLQAPDTIRAFAAWVTSKCAHSGESIELTARAGNRRIHLKVDGRVDAGAVADFLTVALKGDDTQANQLPVSGR